MSDPRPNYTLNVAEYLYERLGKWVPGYVLNTPEVGGQDGTRRSRALRTELGFNIERRRMEGSTAWEYRMMP